MAIEIGNDFISLTIEGRIVAIAKFSQHAAGDGRGAWVVSCQPARLFSRDQAITVLTVAELLEAGYADDDPLVTALREELR